MSFKKSLPFFLVLFSFSLRAQFGTMPPFTVSIEPVIASPLPGLHSFAFAHSGDKWLLVGGRTNGLHGLNASGAFAYEYRNDNIFVVDTSTWTYYSANLDQLPWATADPIRCNNMQSIQEGNQLYMFGGYGYDSTQSRFVTFPVMTAINVDSMISKVMNAQPIASAIRQVTDTNFTVCGGEIGKIGSTHYLIFGHDFEGAYADPPVPIFTQVYSHRIRKFSFTDDGTTISLSAFTNDWDTINYHRRDLNTGPIVNPDGSFGIGAYAGVFRKDSNLPYREPIIIKASGTTINPYQQVMSQYACPLMPIYDSVTQTMYTTFFGGISLYDFNDTTSQIKRDSLIPFINDITTLTAGPTGAMQETILPAKLPGLLGTNARFIPADISMYSNEVIRIRDLPNTKQLAGYIYGGIRAVQGNFGISTSNDTVYRVYITPNNNVGIEKNSSISNVQLFPNPSTNSTLLLFTLKAEEKITARLYDITGKEIMRLADRKFPAGNNQLRVNTSNLSPGIYLCKINGEKDARELKLVVNK